MPVVREYDHWPQALQESSPKGLHKILGGPTMFALGGNQQRQPLIVSTLLHGNEHSGFFGLQKFFQKYGLNKDRPLPRSLIIFIGNTAAAEQNLRTLPNQVDFNRIWDGGNSECHGMGRSLLKRWSDTSPFALVDFHDNTGFNPHYGCVAQLDAKSLHLAALFNRIAVFTVRPETSLGVSASRYFTALTIECGRVGDPFGGQRAFEYLDALMHISEIPQRPPQEQDLEIYQTVGRFLVDKTIPIEFGDSGLMSRGILFRSDLDKLNFSKLDRGTLLGHTWGGSFIREDIPGSIGADGPFVESTKKSIIVARPFVPAMFTTSVAAIRADCLGYCMNKIDF